MQKSEFLQVWPITVTIKVQYVPLNFKQVYLISNYDNLNAIEVLYKQRDFISGLVLWHAWLWLVLKETRIVYHM